MKGTPAIFVGAVGVFALFSPIHLQHKMVIALACAIPPGVVAYAGFKEANEQEQRLKAAQQNADSIVREAQEASARMRAEAEEFLINSKANKESWLDTEKASLERERTIRLAEIANAEMRVSALEQEIQLTKSAIELELAEAQRLKQEALLQSKATQSEQLLNLQSEVDALLSMEQDLQLELHQARLQIQEERSRWQLQKLEEQKQLEVAKAIYTAESEADRQALDREWEIWESEKEQLRRQWHEEVQEELNALLNKGVADGVETVLAEKTAPLFKEIERLKHINAELQAIRANLQEKLEQYQSPTRFRDTSPESLLANYVIDFYWGHKLGLHGVNRHWQDPETKEVLVVEVEPMEDSITPEKLAGKNKGLLDRLRWQLSLKDMPAISRYGTQGYLIYLFTTVQPASKVVQERRYEQLPAITHEYSDGDFQSVIADIEADNHKEDMMSFLEPDFKLIGKGQIADLELQWIEWLIKWRYKSVRLPNMVSVDHIIERVYGVKSGTKTEKPEPVSGLSLRQRVNLIIEQKLMLTKSERLKFAKEGQSDAA